ncbi:MAG: hypothetical protein PUC30_10995 [Lachnospiraceae bacterium]|nr:hypothetical protein [Lachnospiraceae bacterium]
MHILAFILLFVSGSVGAACDGDFSGLQANNKVTGVFVFHGNARMNRTEWGKKPRWQKREKRRESRACLNRLRRRGKTSNRDLQFWIAFVLQKGSTEQIRSNSTSNLIELKGCLLDFLRGKI